MKEEKTYTGGISTEGSKAAKWLDNYWYHYKWHTIGIAFVVIVILVCTVQACSREEKDLSVIYAGADCVQMKDSGKLDSFTKVLEAIMPSDFDGDGDKKIGLVKYDILTKEQIQSYEGSKDEKGNTIVVDRSYYTNQYNNFYSYINTGESSVLLLDQAMYRDLLAHGTDSGTRLMPLNEVLASVPESAIDAYGVRLGDTEWYQKYPAAQIFSPDTVICLLRPLWMGKSSKEELYLQEKQMFAAMVEAPLIAED